MSAAPAMDEVRDALESHFPGLLALLLVPLCEPAVEHTHPRKRRGNDGGEEWVEEPCDKRGKKPRGAGWNEKAVERWTNGAGRAEHLAWIARHVARGGNVGWAIPPGVIVLDCDTAASMAWVARAIPDAPMQRTASGAHFVLQSPGDDIKARVDVELIEGISVDLRCGERSQIVTAPSVHVSGVLYSWSSPLPEDLAELPPCPPLIVDAIRKIRDVQAEAGKLVRVDAAEYPAKTRNDSLFRLGSRLRRDGLTKSEILASLLAVNETRCKPPLNHSEVEEVAESCARYAPAPSRSEESIGLAAHVGYRILNFGDIHPGLEDDYLVKGILSRGTTAALIGAPGSSKTFIGLELSISIASGTPWRGQRTKRGRVVYVAAEGARGIQNRLAAMRKRLALGDAQSVHFHLVPDVVRLTDDSDDVDRLLASIRDTLGGEPVDLVVIDTLSRSIAGRDENSSQDMTAAIGAADRIRSELGAAILLVHHSGKDESRGARGHSSLRAALDTELEVKKIGTDSFLLTVTKARDHESGRQFHHRLEPVEIGIDGDGEPVVSCIVRPADDAPSVAEKPLNVNEQRTHEALRALLAVSDGSAFEAPEAVLKADLRAWVEERCNVSRGLRRGVVTKGLKGLKSKGLVDIEGQRVFLLGDS